MDGGWELLDALWLILDACCKRSRPGPGRPRVHLDTAVRAAGWALG